LARFFRIIPALLILLLVTSYIIGPLITSLPLSEYFSSPQVNAYLVTNLNLLTSASYSLPGVFLDNHYPNVVNGSLWTLSREIEMYLYLLGLSSIGLLKNRIIASIFFTAVILLPITKQQWFFDMYSSNPEVYYLPMSFAFGSMLALWKDNISLGAKQLFGLIILTYLLSDSDLGQTLFYLTTFIFVLFISYRDIFRIPKLNFDISYGVYIYGFLIQQSVSFFFQKKVFYLTLLYHLLFVIQ